MEPGTILSANWSTIIGPRATPKKNATSQFVNGTSPTTISQRIGRRTQTACSEISRTQLRVLYRNAQSKGYQPHPKHKKYLRVADVRNIVQMTTDYRKQKFIFSLLEYALRTKDSKNRFRLPIKAILKFDCCSWKSYSEKMAFCESIGLIQKVREYYRQQRRARTYLINYAFNEDGEQVNSLEEGLKEILDSKTLKLRYSWRVLKKIRKA